MTDSELDGLLLLAFYPSHKEKLNLSNREIFINTILKKIYINKLDAELGENMIEFFPKEAKDRIESGVHILQAFLSDIRIVKMAALKTYDDYRGFIK